MRHKNDLPYKKIFLKVLIASGYSKNELIGPSRKRAETDKRAAISCVMRDSGCTYRQIAEMLHRKHPVVCKSYLPLRVYVQKEIDRIKNVINANYL